MRRRIFLGVLLLVGSGFSIAATQSEFGQLNGGMLERLLKVQKTESTVLFYGKLVDQFGDPVAGAKVLAHVRRANSLIGTLVELKAVSSEDGRFSLYAKKGLSLIIKAVEKPGYDYRYYPNEDRFSYRKGFIPIHVPDESNPVMFKIRKRATKPTFLLYSPYVRLDFNDSSGNEYGHDVLRADMGNSEMRDGWFDDFRVVANRTESATEAVLVFSAGGEDAGFVASSEFLGMAPESGYSGEYVLCVKDGVDPQERYLYLRSRQPLLYSVAELHGVRVGRRGVFVQIRLRTNPLGDRNLEMDEQFPIAARHHIQAKVREAYRDGVPLDVTPLKELIEVARGTTEAESHRIADQVDELVKKVEREERRNFEIDTATLTEMYRKAKKIKD